LVYAFGMNLKNPDTKTLIILFIAFMALGEFFADFVLL
jgi:hypothetical protein